MRRKLIFILFLVATILSGCNPTPGDNPALSGSNPSITPGYSGTVIPYNIAPLNFTINEKGSAYFVKIVSDSGDKIHISSRSGRIRIPQKKWSAFTSGNIGKEFTIEVFVKDRTWQKFRVIKNSIANEPVDPYLYYRLLYPGYESWAELSINMRSLADFRTWPVIKNKVAEDNCVNCHSFNNGRSDNFLFHMRGSLGGTIFYSGGEFRKVNLKTSEMKNGAVYPRWHPSGKYVAFSANKIIQRFHSADNKKVEVTDLESSLVLYDVEKNEMSDINVPGSEKSMDTWPEWSPDGKFLYFCRAASIGEEYDYSKIRYNLYRMPFDPESKFTGEPELIYKADSTDKSVALPRISPDGKFLVFTLADYGCFPVWHKEADLHIIDLSAMKSLRLDLNSDFSDSYHSWSSNSRWLVFSSKRDDGLTSRPYISFIDTLGNASAPFILPQEDPGFYDGYLKSFNVPEFATTEIKTTPWKMRRAAFSDALQAKWQNRFTTFLNRHD